MTIFGAPSDFAKSLVTRRTRGSMTDRIVISRGDLGTLDPATGLVSGLTDGNTIYRGPARIRSLSSGTETADGGAEIVVRQVLISIPMASKMPHVDDIVTVIDGDDDTDLNTRLFRVDGVDGGGLFGDARRMTCTSWLQSRYWSKP